MKRRAFVAGVLAAMVAPSVARAQDAPRLAMLLTGSPTAASPEHDAFIAQLAALGWIEGKQLTVDRRWADGPEAFARLAPEAIAAHPALILTAGPDATRAARQATSTIPIVMIAATDPSVFGVASFARPGGNLTGVTIGPPEAILEKRLQLAREALPSLTRVAVVWDVRRATDSPGIAPMTAAARALRLRLSQLDVKGVRDFDPIFAAAKKDGAECIMLVESPRAVANRALIAELGLSYRLPVVSQFSRIVEAGGFLSYGPDLNDLFRRAAIYVDKILRGAAPGELPIEQPSKFELVINLKTAKALGLAIAPSVQLRADRVIE
jgi:putative tryptophan/tyrosine transport system substrate-binding protein